MAEPTIPEDVREQARALLLDEAVATAGEPDYEAVIVRAIMAERATERERCAKIAEEHLPWGVDRADLYRWNFASTEISNAIKGGQ